MTENEANTIYILKNTIVMNFLTEQALEKVASDIREKTKSGTTASGVRLLLMNGKDKSIRNRFDQYLAASVIEAAKMRGEAAA